jgi:hypothetical protein
MGNGANDVVITSGPVLLHGPAREFEILGDAFVVFGVVDQMHDIADLLVSFRRKHFHIRTVQQLRGSSLFALHVVDAVGLVHAMLLRIQALLLPIKTRVLSGH